MAQHEVRSSNPARGGHVPTHSAPGPSGHPVSPHEETNALGGEEREPAYFQAEGQEHMQSTGPPAGPGRSPEPLLTKRPPPARKANPTSHSWGQTPTLRLPARDLETGWEHVQTNEYRERAGVVASSYTNSPRNIASQAPLPCALSTPQRECRALSADEFNTGLPLPRAPPVQHGWGGWPPSGPSAGRGRQHPNTPPSSFPGKGE